MIARFFVFLETDTFPAAFPLLLSRPHAFASRPLLSSAVRRLPDRRSALLHSVPPLSPSFALLRASLPPRGENGGALCEKGRQAILLKASSRDSTEAVTMSVLAPKP